MEKKYNVDSFNLDHTKVTAPFVRLAGTKVGEKGDIVTKFDIRFCQPNKEFMPTGAIHTLEHLMAEYIRDEMSGVIDLSPMGCRTGFYFTIFGEHTEEEIMELYSVAYEKSAQTYPLLKKSNEYPGKYDLSKVAVWDKPIPATTEAECGNYRDHDLEGAKHYAKQWCDGIKNKGYSAFIK